MLPDTHYFVGTVVICDVCEQGHKELGDAWTEIAKRVRGRSGEDCYRRLKSSAMKNLIASKKEGGAKVQVHRVNREWTPSEVSGRETE